jgi:hypothetical protein
MYFPTTTDVVQRQDAFEAQRRETQERAEAGERARKQNITTFEQMWLSLGSDVLKLDGSRHDAELVEARGLAMNRWSQLLSKEEQVIREGAALASRPKNRPAQQGDDLLPDRTLDARNAAWDDETRHRRESLAALKEQAERERKELEAFLTTRR